MMIGVENGITQTGRLKLEAWREHHRDNFALLHADPIVMADQGGPISRGESDTKFNRYRLAQERTGVSRWAVKTHEAGTNQLAFWYA